MRLLNRHAPWPMNSAITVPPFEAAEIAREHEAEAVIAANVNLGPARRFGWVASWVKAFEHRSRGIRALVRVRGDKVNVNRDTGDGALPEWIYTTRRRVPLYFGHRGVEIHRPRFLDPEGTPIPYAGYAFVANPVSTLSSYVGMLRVMSRKRFGIEGVAILSYWRELLGERPLPPHMAGRLDDEDRDAFVGAMRSLVQQAQDAMDCVAWYNGTPLPPWLSDLGVTELEEIR